MYYFGRRRLFLNSLFGVKIEFHRRNLNQGFRIPFAVVGRFKIYYIVLKFTILIFIYNIKTINNIYN